MLDMRSKKLLGSIILGAIVAVTLTVTPYTLLDPVNLPKLSVLVFFATVVLSFLLPKIKNLFSNDFKGLFILVSIFVFQIILVLIFSGANFGGQIYGTFGRHTGAMAYISLAAMLLGASVVSDKSFVQRFVKVLLAVGVLLIIYGNIQFLGLEPFPYVNLYSPRAPVGTFGNLDFQSAFMGLISVVAITMSITSKFKPLARGSLFIIGILAIFVVYQTTSKQGYLNFISGAGVSLILWMFMTKRKALGIIFTGFGLVGGGLVFAALANIGPIAPYLYNTSVVARGYYWRAAFKMLTDHPFFGVGMDGFIDWYRRSRPEDYLANGFNSYSNTAHNVYLDIASSGGFPLIIIYCALMGFVILSIVRVVKRSSGFDLYFVAIVGAWVAYQAQSLVSINQLGLAIWGWVLSGIIVGYEINTRDGKFEREMPVKNKQKQSKSNSVVQPLSSAAVMRLFGGVTLGALIAIPPYYVNASFFSALKSNDIKVIRTAAYLKPIDERRLLHVATILRDNGMDADAIAIVRDATQGYPDSFDFWQLWSTIPTASPSDLAYAKSQMRRLDPFNPDIR